MTSRTRKSLLILIVLALVGALVFIGFRPHPIAVDVAEVTRGPMVVTINADGKTRIRNIYEVSAPISGTALRTPVEEGDSVVAGETVVARIEPVAPALLDTRTTGQLEAAVREAEAAYRLSKAQLRQAEEEMAFARREVERTQELVERGVASQTTLENAQQALSLRLAALDAAASGVDMSASSLARAKAALGVNGGEVDTRSVEILAPASGTVLEIAQESEHSVAVGAPLLTIGDVNDLEIAAELLSSDAVGLQIGAHAIVERWGGEEDLEARLVSLAPRAQTKVSSLGIEEQRVSAVFDLVTPSAEREGLGHQYAVFLRVVTWEAEDALRLPLSALFRDGEGWAVFVKDGNVARQVGIEIGVRSDDMVEVLSGLEDGDEVIVHPSDDITDGAAVIDRNSL
ncbi:efflux RND transporter periplasmic adaptor subunit [Celeribacter sp.]|uniref:efflux RND transporter periplasmic adaptor subunit n=1 Tax=Celeribacter sp. TaxID=1890673 RepID=UPI003A924468